MGNDDGTRWMSFAGTAPARLAKAMARELRSRRLTSILV